MTLASGCPYVVLLLALVSAGCQSEDTSAKPPFVSVGYGLGPLTAAPLALAANPGKSEATSVTELSWTTMPAASAASIWVWMAAAIPSLFSDV